MSHFSVAVITDSLEKVEALLAPYQENNMDDCPKKYLTFFDKEQECREEYETKTVEKIRMPDGRLLNSWDEEFRVHATIGLGSNTHHVPEHLEHVQVPFKDIYPTLEAFMEQWHCYKKDDETGKYGYWENPNAKWDWWSGELLLKNGKRANCAKIKEVFFANDPACASATDSSVEIAGIYVPKSVSKVVQEQIKEASAAWDTTLSGNGFYKPDYFIQRYGTKEQYIKECISFNTFAVVTPDGKWHERGKMGWFATSSDTPEEAKQFINSYFETFVKPVDPEHYIVIVDCHI